MAGMETHDNVCQTVVQKVSSRQSAAIVRKRAHVEGRGALVSSGTPELNCDILAVRRALLGKIF